MKHCGFAKALLDSLHFDVPNAVKNCFLIVAQGSKQLLSMSPSIIDHGFLRIFLLKYSVDPIEFRNSYPFFSVFMNSSFESNFNTTQPLDEKCRPALSAIFEGNPPVAILLMTVRFFQNVLVIMNLQKHQILDALSEISTLFLFVLRTMNCQVDCLPPLVKGYIQLVECFKCLLTKDFLGAKSCVHFVFDSLDFWTLRIGYLGFGEVLVHQLHLLIAAAAIFDHDMDSEYHSFSHKIKLTYSLMQRPLRVPPSLQDTCKCIPCSLCLCNEPTPLCGIPYNRVASLCTTD